MIRAPFVYLCRVTAGHTYLRVLVWCGVYLVLVVLGLRRTAQAVASLGAAPAGVSSASPDQHLSGKGPHQRSRAGQ